jgi:hypothetical protein
MMPHHDPRDAYDRALFAALFPLLAVETVVMLVVLARTLGA